ncbi:eCIS core domain-containing protein [Streptomyces mangrovi]|uniref:eCIS core domain-containing protein n=1 Tax=Streptomyces mangrovi TaxID=1206892 RepID=UPI00399CECFB
MQMRDHRSDDRSSGTARVRRAPPAAASAPARPPASLLELQRSMGNAAVVRALEERRRHEHAPDRGHGSPGSHAEPVQRAESVHRTLNSSGRPLEEPLRAEMEARLGADFSGVRVHTGAVAQRSAAEIGARAYTSGDHVVIGRGGADKHTLAHELTHVIQQRRGPVAGTDNGGGLSVSDPSDRFEREAEANASRVMRAPLPAAPHAGAPGAADRAADGGPVREAGRPSAPAGPGAAPVQRVLARDAANIYKKWSGSGRLVPAKQREWLWSELLKHCGGVAGARSLSVDQAVEALRGAGVTPAALEEAGVGASGARQAERPRESAEAYEARGGGMVADAERLWKEQEESLPRVTPLSFDIPGLGRGTVAMLRGAGGQSANPGMLAWFSHGYEDANPIGIDTARHYAFAVQVEQSLNRIGGDKDAYASLPGAMAEATAGREPTTQAPGLYVQSHSASELRLEIDRLAALVAHCDVAVLLDFDWAPEVAPEYAEARKAETPPLPVIIERAAALSGYSSLLLFTCRTPWAVDAAVTGSSRLKERIAAEVRATMQLEGQALRDEVTRRTEGAPTSGTVYLP